MRRVWRRVGASILALAALGAGWAAASWRCRSLLDDAARAIDARRYAEARLHLVQVPAWWPARDEVHYLLGVCEEGEGRPDAALEAWARIPNDSTFAERAALRFGRAAMDRGRYADAENTLVAALRKPGPLETDLRQVLIQLLWCEGRLEETARLYEENWRALRRKSGVESPAAIATLRGHLSLDLEIYPVERLQAILNKAAVDAPGDDRVLLGRANLALRAGHPDEADRLLATCRENRPDDPAVWTACLELALATAECDRALEALRHLSSAQFDPGRILEIEAWVAAQERNTEREQRALETLLALHPARTEALARLAELAIAARQTDRASALRRRKGELDRARDRYTSLAGGDLAAHALEMAELAQTLGRRYEAIAFQTLVVSRHPGDRAAKARLVELERAAASSPTSTAAFADLVHQLDRTSNHAESVHSKTDETHLPLFSDDASTAGLVFTYENGHSKTHQLPETMAGGIGLLDYDGDGWLDVYAVQGGPFPPDPERPSTGDRLFRNRGDGTFEDATHTSGLDAMPRGYGHGVAVGDCDNDGWPDLFVTRWRSYALYHNNGDGTFEDATALSGLGGDRDWPTSAAWCDLDDDGDLDLYVCHYLVWDADNPRLCPSPTSRGYTYCAPRLFQALPDHVFRNDHGRFVDVTAQAGVDDHDGRGLGVLAADLDDDGRVDLFVANDGSANFLYRNLGRLRLEETALTAGVTGNDEGGYQAGMGVACGDLDGDGVPDLVVTNFYGEGTSLFHNLGRGLFTDHSRRTGLLAASRYRLGFGVAFLDADNDGRLDLATAYGHVNDHRPVFPYAMPAQLLRENESGQLVDVSSSAGAPWQVPRVGRGLAVGDLDNDGRIDLLILAQNSPVAYFHNQTARYHHFVTLCLEGTASNRDAVAARVTIEAGGRRWRAQRIGGGSFESSSDPRLHFGLGQAERIDAIEVRWPSGRVDRFRALDVDAGYLLKEGAVEARPLVGLSAPATLNK